MHSRKKSKYTSCDNLATCWLHSISNNDTLNNVGGSTEEAKIRNDMTYSVVLANRMAYATTVYNKEFVSIQYMTVY